jgi:hypothetical protein
MVSRKLVAMIAVDCGKFDRYVLIMERVVYVFNVDVDVSERCSSLRIAVKLP